MPRPKKAFGSRRKSKKKQEPIATAASAAADDDNADDADVWWNVRIIDQKVVGRRVKYLVKWEDHPVTGESYAPEWRSASDVTAAAKQDWQEEQRNRQSEPQRRSPSPPHQAHQAAPAGQSSNTREAAESLHEAESDARDTARDQQGEDNADRVREGEDDDGHGHASQAPRPSNWRSIKRARGARTVLPGSRPNSSDPETDDDEAPPHKRAHVTHEPTPYDDSDPVSSVASTASPVPSPEPSSSSQPHGAKIFVDLQPGSQFDPADYLSVENTQASSGSSQAIAQLEDADSRAVFNSQSSDRVATGSSRGYYLSQDASSQQFGASADAGSGVDQPPLVVPDSQETSQGQSLLTNSEHHSAPSKSQHDEVIANSENRSVVAKSQHDDVIANSQHRSVASKSQHDEVTVDSVVESAEAPFRQVDPYSLSQNSSANRETVSSASRPRTAKSTSPERVNSISFLTQPPNLTLPSLHTPSSVVRRSSSNHNTHQADSESRTGPSQPEESLRDSQAAQPHPTLQSLLPESHAATDNSGACRADRHLPSATPVSIQSSETLASYTAGYSSSRSDSFIPNPAIASLQERRRLTMDRSTAGSPAPRVRESSAADELQRLVNDRFAQFDVPSSPPPPRDVPSQVDTIPQVAEPSSAVNVEQPSPLDLLPVTDLPVATPSIAVGAEPSPAMIPSAEFPDFQSQPFGQQSPWLPTSTLLGTQLSEPAVSGGLRSASVVMQDLVNSAFDSPDMPAATISPADITKAPDMEPQSLSSLTSASLPPFSFPLGDQAVLEAVPQSDPLVALADDDSAGEMSPKTVEETPDDPANHIVTLPLQANRRVKYLDTLGEHRREITEFQSIFSSEIFREPKPKLMQKVDGLLTRLYHFCSYPSDSIGTDIDKVPAAGRARYARDASSKLSFVHELLYALRRKLKGLIVCKSLDLTRLLKDVVNAAQEDNSNAQVTFAAPDDTTTPFDYDFVIAVDNSFNGSSMARQLSAETADSPLTMLLVTAYTIEHVDLHVPEGLSPIERKNALLLGAVRARGLLDGPPEPILEPHESAAHFASFLNGEMEPLGWQPATLPDEVLDVFVSTQASNELTVDSVGQENGLKRKLDDDFDSEEDAKRARTFPRGKPIVQTDDPPLNYTIRQLLRSVRPVVSSGETAAVRVPLATLEALAERMAEAQRASEAASIVPQHQALIQTLEAQVKDYERTNNKICKVHRTALEDRSKFERMMKTTQETLDKESEKSKETIEKLEAKVARLTAVQGAPDGMANLLKDAEDKAQKLEKRLLNAQQEAEFARSQYQDASANATASRSQISSLQDQLRGATRMASESTVKIHQIQTDQTNRHLLRQVGELRSMLQERESELERVREEARLSRNGRRETRQSSVPPRSPRTVTMSPRIGRPYSVAASRGTSPAPADANAQVTLPGVPTPRRFHLME